MRFRNHAAALTWRYGRRVRWVLAACCLALALLTLPGDDSGGQRTLPVAARDLPSGARIGPHDVTTVSTDLPLSAPAVAELEGERVRGPVAAGEPLTSSRLVPGRSVRPPAGTVVFPLPVADERIATLLHAGDRVDVLVAADGLRAGRPRIAASDVEVLAVPADETSAAVSPTSGAVVLLALDDVQAQDLAGLRRSDHVSVAIR